MTEPVQLSFSSDVGAETPWSVTGLRLRERFNEPYSMRVALRSDDPLAEPVAMLGATVTITVERGAFTRELHGLVAAVEDGEHDDGDVLASLTVVPALEALRYRRNSRIFPDTSVKDVLIDVLEAGLGPYERSIDVDALGEYPVQEYIVQYQETDLDFVHRLLEEYGIVYRFEHGGGTETMVLFDSDAGYVDLNSYNNEVGVLPLSLQQGGADGQEDARAFGRKVQLRPTVARTTLFDWLEPGTTDFEATAAATLDIPNGAAQTPEREDYEHAEPATLFGFRSAGLDPAQAGEQVALRRKLHQRDAVTFVGRSTATHMAPGSTFELLNHPQADLNAEYLVVSVDHDAGDLLAVEDPEAYMNSFECLPIAIEWRPDRKTKRPRISGIQTATVVGPAGEEIHTDAHGRVKVEFHWDRRKLGDDGASCFIRVVQPWAGNGWGFVFLPRIGMEVAVTFIDGDPDRPVVTGSLYNGANEPPYTLPDDKTKSTIKTRSSPNGGGFNELRFEDAKGSEEIFVHAQKDYNERVLSDHNTWVGNDQTNEVKVNQTQMIHGCQTETVDIDQTMTVKGARTVAVTKAFTETIHGGETRTVHNGVHETITGSETRKVSGGFDETITGGETRNVTGTVGETITGNTTITHHGSLTETVDATYTLTSTGKYTINAPAGMMVTAPGGIDIIDPVKTTFINTIFQKMAGYSGELIGFKFGIIGGKVEIVPVLALAVIGIKADFVGLKIDMAKIKYGNTPLTLEQVATKIRKAFTIIDLDDLQITL